MRIMCNTSSLLLFSYLVPLWQQPVVYLNYTHHEDHLTDKVGTKMMETPREYPCKVNNYYTDTHTTEKFYINVNVMAT